MKKILILSAILAGSGIVGCSSDDTTATATGVSVTDTNGTTTATSTDGTVTVTDINGTVVSTTNGVAGPMTTATLTGTWYKCQTEQGSTSFDTTLIITASTVVFASNTYTDAACSAGAVDDGGGTVSYTLGGSTAFDGVVANITIGTEINFNFSAADGGPTFEGGAIVGTDLYLANTSADSAKDGSTADKRPTTLEPDKFTKL